MCIRDSIDTVHERPEGTARKRFNDNKKRFIDGEDYFLSLIHISRAILGDENSVLTVSAMLRGEYGQNDVYAGVPCIINKNGIFRVRPLDLNEEEKKRLGESCDTLRASFDELEK